MELSIVIPSYNEAESISELTAWIERVTAQHGIDYEVIYIDDGSKDKSWSIIQDLSEKNDRIKGIRFQRNYGKSAALNRGFDAASGEIVITMDSDLQDSPDEIPELMRMIREDGYDLVSGWKRKRFDPLSKTIPTKLFNAATRAMSGIQLNDFNCGLKAYSRDVVKSVEVYGEMHRYIPVLAKMAGFTKIGEKVVQHQERKFGVTKFGMERFINGFLDLISVSFVTKFSKRPMHLFGLLGVISFFAGFGILLYLSISKIFLQEYGMTDRPIFFFGLITILFGAQLFLTGFLAELISRNAPDRNMYTIAEQIGLEQPKADAYVNS